MVSLLGKVDVITYEFENIPMETVTCLSQFRPVRPKHTVLGNIHKYANERGSSNDGDDMETMMMMVMMMIMMLILFRYLSDSTRRKTFCE